MCKKNSKCFFKTLTLLLACIVLFACNKKSAVEIKSIKNGNETIKYSQYNLENMEKTSLGLFNKHNETVILNALNEDYKSCILDVIDKNGHDDTNYYNAEYKEEIENILLASKTIIVGDDSVEFFKKYGVLPDNILISMMGKDIREEEKVLDSSIIQEANSIVFFNGLRFKNFNNSDEYIQVYKSVIDSIKRINDNIKVYVCSIIPAKDEAIKRDILSNESEHLYKGVEYDTALSNADFFEYIDLKCFIRDEYYDDSLTYMNDSFYKLAAPYIAYYVNLNCESVEKLSSDEKLISSIKREIMKRDLGVPPDKKVKLSQAEFHPYKTDEFGDKNGVDPICRVYREKDEENRNIISLTFDSGDTDIKSYIYEIMDILEERDIRATFFMTYEYMKENPDHVIDVVKRGHEIGNHTDKHRHFSELSDREIIEEVLVPHMYVKELTGIDMCLFRYPFGEYTDRSIELLKAMGYYPIQWNLDSIDWRGETFDIVYGRLAEEGKVYSGTIVLFHVWPENTPIVLPLFLDYIDNIHLKCVKVSDLIIKHDFNMSFGRQYRK